MAHIAHSLEKYPELARETSPYRFGSVITLGAPVGSNLLPRETKLRHYFSPEDKVVRWTTLYGTFALRVLGYPVYVREVPPNLSSDSKVRIFLDIGHPYWNEERVVERILAEFEAAETPAWQDRERTVGMGSGLASLLAQAVELGWNLSLEDPPRDDTSP